MIPGEGAGAEEVPSSGVLMPEGRGKEGEGSGDEEQEEGVSTFVMVGKDRKRFE